MAIMACLLDLAVFPATAVNLAPSLKTAIIRGSATAYQEWLEKSVIAVLMAFTRCRMVAVHVSSNPWFFQGLCEILFSSVLYFLLQQCSVGLINIPRSLGNGFLTLWLSLGTKVKNYYYCKLLPYFCLFNSSKYDFLLDKIGHL